MTHLSPYIIPGNHPDKIKTMTCIKRVVFDPDWLEQFLCEFYRCTMEAFSTSSMAKKHHERKVIFYYLMHTQADLHIRDMAKRYNIGMYQIYDFMIAGKDLDTPEKNFLVKKLESFVPFYLSSTP